MKYSKLYQYIFSIIVLFSCTVENRNISISENILIENKLDYIEKLYGSANISNKLKVRNRYPQVEERYFLYQNKIYHDKQILKDAYIITDLNDYLKKIRVKAKQFHLERDSFIQNNKLNNKYFIKDKYKKREVYEYIIESNGEYIDYIFSGKNLKRISVFSSDISNRFRINFIKTLKDSANTDPWFVRCELIEFYDRNNYKIDSIYEEIYHYRNEEFSRSNWTDVQKYTYILDNLNYAGLYDKKDIFEKSVFKRNNSDKVYDVDSLFSKDIQNFCSNYLKDFNIIILNENHFNEKSRYTAMLFLKELRRIGFKDFAAEDFERIKDTPMEINELEGFYINQPTFSSLVTYADHLGYNYVGYEVNDECSKNMNTLNCRDSIQYINIKNYIQKNKVDKLFIYVGHGHNSKLKLNNLKTLRVFLDENFPDYKFFSIDQMGFMNDYTLNKNGIVTQYNEKLKIINPEILIKGDTLFSSDYYDSKVLSPMRSPAYWFHEKSDIFSKEIKLSPPESTEYIDVYNSNLSESRMPVYRTKIKNIDNYSIYLPKSDYRVKYFNKKFEEVR